MRNFRNFRLSPRRFTSFLPVRYRVQCGKENGVGLDVAFSLAVEPSDLYLREFRDATTYTFTRPLCLQPLIIREMWGDRGRDSHVRRRVLSKREREFPFVFSRSLLPGLQI